MNCIMRRSLQFLLLLFIAVSINAQSDYYMRLTKNYQHQAEYYTRQALNYDRQTAYYNRQAQGLLRNAEYYSKREKYDQVKGRGG